MHDIGRVAATYPSFPHRVSTNTLYMRRSLELDRLIMCAWSHSASCGGAEAYRVLYARELAVSAPDGANEAHEDRKMG